MTGVDWSELEDEWHQVVQWSPYREGYKSAADYVRRTLESAGFEYLGQGAARATYLTPSRRHVVKVTIGRISQNRNELELSKTWRQPHTKVRRLTKSGWAIVATRVSAAVINRGRDYEYGQGGVPVYGPLLKDDDLPGWASIIDGGQVGIDPKGRIVAYDYGIEWA